MTITKTLPDLDTVRDVVLRFRTEWDDPRAYIAQRKPWLGLPGHGIIQNSFN